MIFAHPDKENSLEINALFQPQTILLVLFYLSLGRVQAYGRHLLRLDQIWKASVFFINYYMYDLDRSYGRSTDGKTKAIYLSS